jgi:uncharacterized protein (DUF433 family)
LARDTGRLLAGLNRNFLERRKNMTRDELLQRISIDPNVCFGKPCIKGHRIWVSLVLDLLASGWSIEQLLANYPAIEEADIRACIVYAAEMSRERYVDIPVGSSR